PCRGWNRWQSSAAVILSPAPDDAWRLSCFAWVRLPSHLLRCSAAFEDDAAVPADGLQTPLTLAVVEDDEELRERILVPS
ncbi:hypothetical protein, partial [Klebsiella pneumoniae]|uniref:hypothetical protein n=1 Tax=Klebsiella pneumoniae TaxID=573 RepID=UPI0022B6A155